MLGNSLFVILLAIVIVACCITAFAIAQKYSLGIKFIIYGVFLIFLISPILTLAAVVVAPYLTDDPWGKMGLALGTFLYAEIFSIGVLVLGLAVFLVKKFSNPTGAEKNNG